MGRKTDKEEEQLHFQTGRFIQQNGEWYYLTREGEERGPFEDMEDASGDLILYLRSLHNEMF